MSRSYSSDSRDSGRSSHVRIKKDSYKDRSRSQDKDKYRIRDSKQRRRDPSKEVETPVAFPVEFVNFLTENKGVMKKIVEKIDCQFHLKVDENNQSEDKIRLSSGQKARLVIIKGTPQQCADGLLHLQNVALSFHSENRQKYKYSY